MEPGQQETVNPQAICSHRIAWEENANRQNGSIAEGVVLEDIGVLGSETENLHLEAAGVWGGAVPQGKHQSNVGRRHARRLTTSVIYREDTSSDTCNWLALKVCSKNSCLGAGHTEDLRGSLYILARGDRA